MSLIYKLIENDSDSSDDDPVMAAYTELGNQIFDDDDGPSDPIAHRRYINRNREEAHERLVAAYFCTNPLYNDDIFETRFRMTKRLFLRIANDMASNFEYFTFRTDARGRQSFTTLQKCTSAVRQLAYGTVPDALDEYLQMATRTSRETLEEYCKGIIELYRKQYMRRPTVSDVRNLYELHEREHGFRGMLGSIDCTHWIWKNCPTLWRGQYVRGDIKKPTIMLEAVASQDLWFWHTFFGVAGSNNDITVIRQSPIFNDVINETAPVQPFEVNGATYRLGYYLGDGIYPPLSTIVKSFSYPGDPKRQRFKAAQEAARKDVERAFGRLKGKWGILQVAARAMTREKIRTIMDACCILHNMTLEDEGNAACPYYEHELPSQEEVRARNQQILLEIYSAQLHRNLQADLVEHIHNAYVPRLDRPNPNNQN